MDIMRRWAVGLLLLLAAAAGPAAPAGAGQAAAPPVAAAGVPEGRAFRDWWAAHRWRYPDDARARIAYRALVERELPWPEWHQPRLMALPKGTRFQMALAPGQPSNEPGAFGTFDPIPNVEYVRLSLAVKTEWKAAIDRVVTYEVTQPLIVDTGLVGPQIDAQSDRYLPGGGSQLQIMIHPAQRMQHLQIVGERPIQ